ncbi:MAG TPA: type II toxin-antitoxin system VapC family toxin [Gemmatimonadaceae bacterium]|nr:type II toxin-antitoxin system VapC family toxin [Gemmatimonadaceae bacterium]
MGIVLDTSILIAAECRALRFEALLESLGDEPVAISAITASELLHGCHRATNAGVRARRSAFVEALLDAIPILPFGLGEARLHAEIWAELARQGMVIGPHDLLIAASAMARGYGVASMNRAEFARIAGLQVVAIDRFLS